MAVTAHHLTAILISSSREIFFYERLRRAHHFGEMFCSEDRSEAPEVSGGLVSSYSSASSYVQKMK